MTISKYEKGFPCMLGEVVGRIVGESDKGSWGDIDGEQFYSIPLFVTPHGTVIETGVLHLKDITDEGMRKLIEYEEDAKARGDDLYAGHLNNK